MPRPRKCRSVCFVPRNNMFYPQLENPEEVVLSIEEVEAVRLSDIEAMEQDACAECMQISRGTYQRIIDAARYKLADAVVNGKTIRIEGGSYIVSRKHCNKKCRRFCADID